MADKKVKDAKILTSQEADPEKEYTTQCDACSEPNLQNCKEYNCACA